MTSPSDLSKVDVLRHVHDAAACIKRAQYAGACDGLGKFHMRRLSETLTSLELLEKTIRETDGV